MKSCALFVCFTAFFLVFARSAQAQLPTFTYNLNTKPLAEKQNLCEQNKGYCITNCGGINQAPKNFCNATTMGWGCGCLEKIPDYQAYEWPINYQDCLGHGEACKTACQSDQVPADQKGSCNTACVSSISSKCGTKDQPPAYYNVNDMLETPTYGPKTNSNNSTSKNGTSSSNNGTGSSNSAVPIGMTLYSSLGSAVSAFIVVVGGMMLL
ncbi:6008_t:CDS:2 [Ambispora gerdemannii]|uniref:6008_t:CDS:1 n=1 Tax=Ambispora gerdemannii TaxID=144530 RepID=A0A9N8ZY05_9GLOM|nr:6008_t:CDS:2 [Ambispora gerdemannii]